MKEDKILEEALARFEDAEEGWSDNREEALDDLKFARLGEQWPEDIAEQRQNEGRPCLTINKLPAFIRQVVNDARLNTPSIKVHPVDDNADPDTAEVINGLIRNIEAVSNADQAYDTSLESAVTNGFGYFRVDIEYASQDVFDLDIEINTIPNPLSVYPDPNSTALDASDWEYCFIVEDLSEEVFAASYPNADKVDWEGKDSQGWVSDNTIRVAEYWKREEIETELLLLSDGTVIHKDQYEENIPLFDAAGTTIAKSRPCKTYKVTQYIMNGAEVMETNEHPGTLIPIIPVFGDIIVVEEKRYCQSLVRQAKDAQRNYNYWRSASTEKVALATKAPWIGPTGSFDSDVRKWESANTETHAFLEYDGPMPPSQTAPSMADAGSMTEALSASDDFKNIMGMQDASLGIAGNETSGRAITARKREGDISTYHFVDNLSRAMTYAGKVILELIPHVYNTPRVMRVLGYDGEPETVQVNQQFDVNGMAKLHDLTKGKYDLVVTTGPSFTSKREEAATQMTELLRSFPQAAPIIGDLVAKNLDWPGADEIAKRLKTLLPPEIQAMEKMDGLPPEAQAAIAQSQQQVQQLSQVIEQGKQLLQQKDEEIKGLNLEKKSKQDELFVKDEDSKRKFTADMAKVEADKEMTAFKENEENRRMIVNEVAGFLKDYVDQSSQTQQDSMKTQQDSTQGMLQGFDVFAEMIEKLSDKVEDMSSQSKTIEIQAPSGGIYKGVVNDNDIEIQAPSGATYTGNITEH